MRRYVFLDMGKKWRERRNTIFHEVYGDICQSLDHYIRAKPNLDYDARDWERFIKYRLGTKGQKRSKTNKENRKAQTIYETSGSKPFKMTEEELVTKVKL
ncbi:hypothetical protein LINGRAHAP2_LOCUS7667 [Linum grandiflorum]